MTDQFQLTLLPVALTNGILVRAPRRPDVEPMQALQRALSSGSDPVVAPRAAHRRDPDAQWASMASEIPRDELRIVVVADATSDAFLGFAGLLPRAQINGPEFYCYLDESSRGRRVGETVGRWLVAAAFAHEHASAVCSVVKPTNFGALRLAYRLGFREATDSEAARIAVQEDQRDDRKLIVTATEYLQAERAPLQSTRDP